MNAEQRIRSINHLDRILADLENKMAYEKKRESDANKKILDIERSITKNTSASMLQSKQNQIGSFRKELINILAKKADINKRIAEKRARRANDTLKLHQEEEQQMSRLQDQMRYLNKPSSKASKTIASVKVFQEDELQQMSRLQDQMRNFNKPSSIASKGIVSIKLSQEELQQMSRLEYQMRNFNKPSSIASKRIASVKLFQEDEQQMSRLKNQKYQSNELVSPITPKAIACNQTGNIYSESSDEYYDVFISHASEDKESFVDKLNQEMLNRNIKVWYDSINIKWGDSLRTKIDEGLKKSKYGIVILSVDYIKKGWTQYELEGLFNIEMVNGKTILPIWHNIDKKGVQEFSPTLAGRKALSSTMMTPAEIVDELMNLLDIKK